MIAAALQIPVVGDIVGEGRFELLRELGEGGMATVFVAADRLLGREVALKLLIPRYVGRPEREQRLINEAEYLRRVQGHPNVIEFIDAGRLSDRNGWPWLSTEILVGEDLGWLFTHGKIEIPRVVSIARQTAAALAACHEAGVVHRDLTPSNVFVLAGSQTIKLFDFSHAADLHAPKLAVGASERLTTIFDTPGTLGYMGPEQVMKAPPEVSMDAFAFGILLYKLVSGRDPYQQYTDRSEFIRAQREGRLEQPRLFARAYGAPQELADLVHDCTQRDGTKRPTMNEIIARLDAIGMSPQDEPVASEPTQDVTEAVDAVSLHAERSPAPALMQSRQPVQRTVLEGDWTVANQQQPTWGPAPTLAVAAPVVDPNPAPQDEEYTVELAFARPPQQREAEHVFGSTSGPPGRVFAQPPELRQLESGASADLDPEAPPAYAAPPASSILQNGEEPVPIGRSRTKIVGLIAGLGLLVTILSWFAYAKLSGSQSDREKKIDGGRDRSTTSPHYTNGPTESDDEPLEGEAGADDSEDDSETVAETGGMEIDPVEQPKPKNGRPKNGKPKNGNDSDGDKPDPTCEGVEDEGRAATDRRKWAVVLQLTDRKRCWSSNDERTRLRVKAFLSSRRNEDCIKAGQGSRDPEILDMVKTCEALLDRASSSKP